MKINNKIYFANLTRFFALLFLVSMVLWGANKFLMINEELSNVSKIRRIVVESYISFNHATGHIEAMLDNHDLDIEQVSMLENNFQRDIKNYLNDLERNSFIHIVSQFEVSLDAILTKAGHLIDNYIQIIEQIKQGNKDLSYHQLTFSRQSSELENMYGELIRNIEYLDLKLVKEERQLIGYAVIMLTIIFIVYLLSAMLIQMNMTSWLLKSTRVMDGVLHHLNKNPLSFNAKVKKDEITEMTKAIERFRNKNSRRSG